MMRQKYLGTVKRFEPFTALLDGGATPSQVRESIVGLLDPYVHDKDLLQELAVSVLANEAASVAQLSSRPDWKALLDAAFSIREAAISVNEVEMRCHPSRPGGAGAAQQEPAEGPLARPLRQCR